MLFLLLACTGAPDTYTGGSFQFYTLAVQDDCYGGAMEAVFMPEGAGTEQAFANEIYLPSFDEVGDDGFSSTVELQAPFTSMDVVIDSDGSSTLSLSGVSQTGVLLNEDLWADCVGDIDFDVTMTVDSATEVSGVADLITSNPVGDTCETPDSDPCTIELTLRAELVE
jgi:hypothetical protein